ncbi:hypothetical protein PHYSODRAFT_305149 [Phytophthora sojae]|uniref:Uncharacterized protein n=1 Tax=Phytophthora sojae (strain P6497) TaxID=1094619 RepID=G5A4X6_PHYSP|nr:hypothetical protein PHYSODRAFT_305149 [Phytophthora sojae]EGZ09725.1 hypothetical protein PHYSODRAFT_305149 [Phytophthora sojae]|eukprot:XP_009534586.1 hypothetical protein PHYSODRAFT_305149 [Phytophthora sojae]
MAIPSRPGLLTTTVYPVQRVAVYNQHFATNPSLQIWLARLKNPCQDSPSMHLSSFLLVAVVTLVATSTSLATAEDSVIIKNAAADSNRVLSSIDNEEQAYYLPGLKTLKSAFGKKWTKLTEALKKKINPPSDGYKKKVKNKRLRDENNFIRR